MASIKIHQDLFNFKKTRKGFTDRQLGSFAIAVVGAVFFNHLLGYGIGLPTHMSITFAIALVIPVIVCGFAPIYGMPAEEFIQRSLDLSARGSQIVWEGEEVEPMKGEVSRAYRKKTKKRGAECRQ